MQRERVSSRAAEHRQSPQSPLPFVVSPKLESVKKLGELAVDVVGGEVLGL